MENVFYDLSDTELRLCLVGKIVKYSCEKGVFFAILVGVHGDTTYFRPIGNLIDDIYSVDNAKIFYEYHDFITVNKITKWTAPSDGWYNINGKTVHLSAGQEIKI